MASDDVEDVIERFFAATEADAIEVWHRATDRDARRHLPHHRRRPHPPPRRVVDATGTDQLVALIGTSTT